MRLLNTSTIQFLECHNDDVPWYAILSHTWGDEEVSFQEMRDGLAKDKSGFTKIISCCNLAASDGWDYVWVDTCCIDKTSSAELSEAINSMFEWYQRAQVCYAYLVDVPANENDHGNPCSAFCSSRWFTRGWTLQELLAPANVIFFNQDWVEIGTKSNLSDAIWWVTGILRLDMTYFKDASVAVKMSWASKRKTTRTEDMAYCLMGLFGVNMPLLYGEGKHAFVRLQLEILKLSDDETIFAWETQASSGCIDSGLLAPSPAEFRHSGNIRRFTFDKGRPEYSMTNKGLRMGLLLSDTKLDEQSSTKVYLAPLNCTRDLTNPLAVYLRRNTENQDSVSQVFTRHCPRGGRDSLPVMIDRLQQMQRETIFIKQLEWDPDRKIIHEPRLFSIKYPPSHCRISELRIDSVPINLAEKEPGECKRWLNSWEDAAVMFDNWNYQGIQRFAILLKNDPFHGRPVMTKIATPRESQTLKEIEEFHAGQVWQRLRTDGICKVLESGYSVSVAFSPRRFRGDKHFAVDVAVDANIEANGDLVLPEPKTNIKEDESESVGIERYTESKENVRRERGTEKEGVDKEGVDKEEGENGEEEEKEEKENGVERMENGENDGQLGKDKVTKYNWFEHDELNSVLSMQIIRRWSWLAKSMSMTAKREAA